MCWSYQGHSVPLGTEGTFRTGCYGNQRSGDREHSTHPLDSDYREAKVNHFVCGSVRCWPKSFCMRAAEPSAHTDSVFLLWFDPGLAGLLATEGHIPGSHQLPKILTWEGSRQPTKTWLMGRQAPEPLLSSDFRKLPNISQFSAPWSVNFPL